MLRINDIKLDVNKDQKTLVRKIAMILGINPKQITKFKIVKKSIDARNKDSICFVYCVDVELPYEEKYLHKKNVTLSKNVEYRISNLKSRKLRPIVIGAGPAGLFAALIMSEAGLRPIIIERGKSVYERKKDVELFWKTGKLNTSSNAQFGEGGAGAFSDGKLTTGINDARIYKVISEFVKCGAPREIEYIAKPHIGTDRLISVIENIRLKIESMGGQYMFNTKLKSINVFEDRLNGITIENVNGLTEELECEYCILATGHSARDTYEMLYQNGVHMQAKAFSAGVRIEHNQMDINKAQYGIFWKNKKLGSAEYKLSANIKGRGVYTFCMCPGGRVICASSEKEHLAINGMSYYARDLINANSALLVSLFPSDFPGDHPLRAINFQRDIESRAFNLGGGNYFAPIQLVGDFMKGTATKELGRIAPSYIPGYTPTDLRECLPEFIHEAIKGAIIEMGKKIQGFDSYDSILTAVESRSSSPVRILRDKNYSSNILGLIPCGEGAGYAGGIMSACVDGIKCAEILQKS